MSWFKICLLIVIGLSMFSPINNLTGWLKLNPKPIDYAMNLVIDVLCFVGIWFLVP